MLRIGIYAVGETGQPLLLVVQACCMRRSLVAIGRITVECRIVELERRPVFADRPVAVAAGTGLAGDGEERE